MTQDRVARESKIPTDAGAQAIRNEINRKHRIYVKLVDWVLSQTVFAGDPVERAVAQLKSAGLNESQLNVIRGLINTYRVQPQDVNLRTAQVEVNHDTRSVAITPTLPHPSQVANRLREEQPEYGRKFKLKGMPEPNMKAYNTRDELPRYKMSFTERKRFTPIKLFRDLAAGYGGGENYEVMENAYVEGVPREGHTIAQVRGESMVKTLYHGDFVLLKDFPPPGYVLPQIESKEERMPLDFWKSQTRIGEGDIVVVEIAGQPEGKTLKRIHYDTRRGANNWKMKIVADNPDEWIKGGWQVEDEDHITFYGILMGLCDPV